MSAAARLLNTAWLLKCQPEAAAFEHASRRVARTQARLLLGMLWANRYTHFGQAPGFASIASVRQYQERVPPATYEDLAPHIERIAAGEANVLTAEPVRLLEPTSGTMAAEKLIPYTAGLRRQFQRGIATWLADLLGRRPRLRAGRACWSISPALGPPRRSPGGLPIGFDDDTGYLGGLERFALRRLLIAPPELARLTCMETFRYTTLLFLLAAEDLTLISVWSPTFLTALAGQLGAWEERLCHDLRAGQLNPPTPLPADVLRPLRHRLRPEPRRAAAVARALRSRQPLTAPGRG